MSARWTAAVLITAFALTGCYAGDDTAEPAPSASATTLVETETATESASPTGSAESDDFVAVIREQLPEISSGRTDTEIKEVARLACQALASGTTADQLVAAVQSLGTLDAEATDQATARELVKLAIDTTCPDQASRVDEF